MRRFVLHLFWRALALFSLLLGLVGVFVPGLPTVPFLLLAAWAAGKGWPALEAWLLAHPDWGPLILRWRERGCVPRRAKWWASAMMTASVALIYFSQAPGAIKLAVPVFLLCVALWLWRRPEA